MNKRVLPVLLLLCVSAAAADFKAADGTALHYSTLGKGEPIVLLAGGPGFSTDYMRGIGEHLAARYQVVLFEQRGTPKSPLERYDGTTLTLPLAVADLEALRTKLGVEQLTLAGHSFGGMLSMAYAVEHPDRVRALVLIDSGGASLDFTAGFGDRLDARMTPDDFARFWNARFPKEPESNPRHAAVEALRARTPAYFHDQAKAKPVVAALNDDWYDHRTLSVLMGDLRVRRYDLRPALKKLAIPVLIVQGDDDPIGTFDELREAMPYAKAQLIKDAGHFSWIEQPAAFWGVVDRFLKALRPPERGGTRRRSGR
jgi:proline iminopeptidase